MPIELITGLPGAGKTALMVERLDAESKKATRPIFAGGIEGLIPGIATVLDDPRDWNKKDANGVHVVPDGSLIFVDEAWKWFGHLHDATRQATPTHVLALAEHRHRGIDFVWTTQTPSQIYPFARGMIATHKHSVRRFGSNLIDVFQWEELNDDVKSATKRDNAQRTSRFIPSESFDKYKSASDHTIKMRLPWKVWALPGMVILAAALAWFAYTKLKPTAMAHHGKAGTDAALAASAQASGDATGGKRVVYASVEDYVQVHTPRIATKPWTAPVFDQRGITADPQVFCMESEAGQGADGHRVASVTCLTEQGTPYKMEPAEAKMLARWGASYNPYKAKDEHVRNESDAPGQQRTQAVPQTRTIGGSPLVAPYGDIARPVVADTAGGASGV